MKTYFIVIAIGVLAIGGFFFWQNNTMQAPEPAPAPTIPESAPKPAPTPVANAPKPTPPPQSLGSQMMPRPKINKEAPEQRLIIVGQDTIVKNGQTFNPAQFTDRVAYGDIPAAISKFQNETDPDMKIAYLGDLASQPAESAEIHAIFIDYLQNPDEELRSVAFEAALSYEDRTMIPALKKLLVKKDSGADSKQVEELILLLEAEPYRNIYYDSKGKK